MDSRAKRRLAVVYIVVIWGIAIATIALCRQVATNSGDKNRRVSDTELWELVRAEVPAFGHPGDYVQDHFYKDVTGDGCEELMVCAVEVNSQKTHFIVYMYKSSKWISAYHAKWIHSFNGVEFTRLPHESGIVPSDVVIVRYCPAAGTGWLPLYRDVIWWDGKSFRTVWSGLTDCIESRGKDGFSERSVLDFYIGSHQRVMLEVVTVRRRLVEGTDSGWEGEPGSVLSVTVRKYMWDRGRFVPLTREDAMTTASTSGAK